MKRKAASQLSPAIEQPINKISFKKVTGTPLDTDQEAHVVLCATAPSYKAMMPQPGAFGQHLLKGFAALWNDRSQLADVILSVGDQQVPAHSCVLCVWSEVFKALLTRWSAQRTDNGAMAAAVTVDLSQGDSPEDFLELLHFCYVGTCQLDSHNVMPLLRLSNYYEILPLKESCGEFLFELLTARKCLKLLLKLTERYVCTRARRMLIQHIAQTFETLLEEGVLWQLPCRVWQEILIQTAWRILPLKAMLLPPLLPILSQSKRALAGVTNCVRVIMSKKHVLSALNGLSCNDPQSLKCIRGRLRTLYLGSWLFEVANESAVLTAAWRYSKCVQLAQEGNGMKDAVMERLLPCVRLPQLGLTTLLARVEQDTLLMSLGVTKDYLANAYKCLLLTREGMAAKPLPARGPPAGYNSWGNSEAGDYEARRREITMLLQDRPRRPPLSFTSPHPEGRNLGFTLEHGRCTATAQTEGVLRTACWEEGFGPRHDPRGGPAPVDPHSCYTVVQPGLVSGSMYVELLVQSTQPASRGPSGLRIWVVRNLRVETHPDDPVAPPIWDGCGLVYGRMARATPDGQDGKVQIVTSRSALDSRFRAYLPQPPTLCEGFSQGDIIGVGMRILDGDGHMSPGHPQYQGGEQLIITVHKNGVFMAKHKVASAPINRNRPDAQRLLQAKKDGQWQIMVSSGTPGDSVQLLRPPPTQAAKPSTVRVPEAAQPAAQLDARSQRQRRSAALKELMTAQTPNPQTRDQLRADLQSARGYPLHADWTDEEEEVYLDDEAFESDEEMW